MPVYEYQCTKCKKKFEMLQKINSEPLKKCISCNGDVDKLISASSFQLKGSGWYINDYKSKDTQKSPKKSTVTADNKVEKTKNATTK